MIRPTNTTDGRSGSTPKRADAVGESGRSGSASAAPGSAIHMTGSNFENTSTSAAAMAGLSNLTLVFEGGGSVREYAGGYADWVRQRAAVADVTGRGRA